MNRDPNNATQSRVPVAELGPLFAVERDAEYTSFSLTQAPVHVSPYNPKVTARWDEERRDRIREHMRHWSSGPAAGGLTTAIA